MVKMLMSAVGSSKGFTILELLVVISIIAIASAGISFSLRDSSETKAEKETLRLVALLESARAQSRLTGIPVIWHPTSDGFAFEGVPANTMPVKWLESTMLVERDMAYPKGSNDVSLLLGPEPIIGAQGIILKTEGEPASRFRVFSDGLHPFRFESVRKP
ncbi:MAG: prepilin-type N-terminal cleavage/methylation domain-containing protein [Pseudomonadota bacterium]